MPGNRSANTLCQTRQIQNPAHCRAGTAIAGRASAVGLMEARMACLRVVQPFDTARYARWTGSQRVML
jgi:hypothetical protein